jgi:hypothetical protein
MPHNNEQVIQQWEQETAAEYFDRVQDYDGTERKDDVPTLDGGIIGVILDNADRDLHDRENEQYDNMVEAIENELSDQIEWLYYPTPQMFSQLEALAEQWAKDNNILPYIAGEAISTTIADIKRRKESLTDKDPAPITPTKRIKYTEYFGDNFTHLQSYDVYFD